MQTEDKATIIQNEITFHTKDKGIARSPSDAFCYHKHTLSYLFDVLHVLPLVTHIIPVPKAVCPLYSRSYIPLKYFNSQFQWTKLAKKIKLSSFFSIGVTALNKSFQNKKCDKIRILHFVLPQLNISNLSLSCIMLSADCGEELRD
jgi:hypothetical protein